ncbi:MAG TPA: hypothetical protein VFN57_03170 [Thermomicrobiaceae bacterium]|nr:hypothetical protein [Thermomicrobiaceae bacterium]
MERPGAWTSPDATVEPAGGGWTVRLPLGEETTSVEKRAVVYERVRVRRPAWRAPAPGRGVAWSAVPRARRRGGVVRAAPRDTAPATGLSRESPPLP